MVNTFMIKLEESELHQDENFHIVEPKCFKLGSKYENILGSVKTDGL